MNGRKRKTLVAFRLHRDSIKLLNRASRKRKVTKTKFLEEAILLHGNEM